jgi:hypothetical protein
VQRVNVVYYRTPAGPELCVLSGPGDRPAAMEVWVNHDEICNAKISAPAGSPDRRSLLEELLEEGR